ncbi:hypothetical protein OnM2_052053 [Erysiphe neolycopersici]|uniref:CCHC-type domain-containing protein n=1 Tax=Erysiphe neolycopersici TaxID=212602 RepID=A0A420HS76_9PEZI|nr:hypothetical protein OnM2_052053 [Erysiphe neolycopersici]
MLRVREEIENRNNATEAGVAYVKLALEERFPGCVSDQVELSVQSKVETLRQSPEEPLAVYYARTTSLINRTRGRDRLKAESVGIPLTGLEEFTLSAIITAYTRGLCQEVIIETQRTMELMRQYEDQAAQNHELHRLRDLVVSDYGQLSSVFLGTKAELSRQGQLQLNFNHKNRSKFDQPAGMEQAPVRPPQLDFAQQHKNLHPQSPLYSSHLSRGQGNTRGRGRMQNSLNWRDTTGPKNEGNPHHSRSSSLNSYVNMSITYDKSVHLCVGCGETGHLKPNCKNPPLQLWEQAYLKQMGFGGQGINAHLLVLENQGYAYERASAASSVLSNPIWAPSPKEYCTQRITDAFPQRCAKNKKIAQSMKTENYVESESEEEPISLATLMADPARKHQRGDEGKIKVQDLLNSESSSRPRKLRTPVGKPEKNGMKAVKVLREIVGREGHGLLDYRALAEKINVPLKLLEFFQASPDVEKKFR